MSQRYRGADEAPEFVQVARVEDVLPGQIKRVEVDGREVALVNLDGSFFAIDNNCPHNGGPLARGSLDLNSGQLTCPWHAWTWDVRTGRAVAPPIGWRAVTYQVRVEGPHVLVSRRPG
jgi:nitrite reductase/ring-hydroxylating ferredoxin subunit